MLQTVPSFSVFASADDGDGDQERKIQDQENLEAARAERGEDGLERTVTIGDCITADAGGSDFSFGSGNRNMDLIEEEKEEEEQQLGSVQHLNSRQEVEPVSPPMYLATGLGIDNFDFGSSLLELVLPNFDGDEDMEEYYKRMVNDFPCHPLFLRNYAQLLQSKGDFDGADDYFLRATLADPDNAELLLQYAQFVWEVRHDRDKALIFFERATQVAPQDSNILAAYARFVWEIDSESEEDGPRESPQEESQDGLTAEEKENQLAVDPDNGFSTEDGYKKMLEDNPQNPSLLRSYARFLHRAKGDLHRDFQKEMYSRAISAEPRNGEAMAAYAQLVWQLHRDFQKASSFFERAVKASPQDSQILGAYASFVWETDQDEEEVEDHGEN